MKDRIHDAQWAECPEHGLIDRVDEDGCCLTCGADSMVYGALVPSPASKVRRLMEAVKRLDYVENDPEDGGKPEGCSCAICGVLAAYAALQETE